LWCYHRQQACHTKVTFPRDWGDQPHILPLHRCLLPAPDCLQLISSLKQLQLAQAPGFDIQLLSTLMDIANVAATTGSSLWAQAAGALEATATAGDAPSAADAATSSKRMTALQAAAPTLPGWLFTTGRSLVEVGQLLQQAPAWLNATAAFNSAPHQLIRRVACVSKHAEALTFLQDVLTELQDLQQAGGTESALPADAPAAANSPEPADAATADAAAADTSSGGAAAEPAAAAGAGWGGVPVPPETLQKLQQQVSGLLLQYQPLLEQCRAAEASADRAALASALRAFVGEAAGTAGWLVQGLQDVGSAVCAAFPVPWACNDPTCSSMEGLSESASVKKCGACKVCRVSRCSFSLACVIQIQGLDVCKGVLLSVVGSRQLQNVRFWTCVLPRWCCCPLMQLCWFVCHLRTRRHRILSPLPVWLLPVCAGCRLLLPQPSVPPLGRAWCYLQAPEGRSS
jgi:hypothetical protein